jgi:hypothetical protein
MSGIVLALAGATTNNIPAIGAAYEGGYFAGQISTTGTGVANYNLVIGPKATAQFTQPSNPDGKFWKTTNTTTAGTNSYIEGAANSAQMANAQHPAGQFCENLTVGGYSDWYMPAFSEWGVIYSNLKPTTGGNALNTGQNSYAVPPRPSNYTNGDPAQTTVSAFQAGGAEALTNNANNPTTYWSSTENSASTAWGSYMGNGQFSAYTKATPYVACVRGIRRIAV